MQIITDNDPVQDSEWIARYHQQLELNNQQWMVKHESGLAEEAARERAMEVEFYRLLPRVVAILTQQGGPGPWEVEALVIEPDARVSQERTGQAMVCFVLTGLLGIGVTWLWAGNVSFAHRVIVAALMGMTMSISFAVGWFQLVQIRAKANKMRLSSFWAGLPSLMSIGLIGIIPVGELALAGGRSWLPVATIPIAFGLGILVRKFQTSHSPLVLTRGHVEMFKTIAETEEKRVGMVELI